MSLFDSAIDRSPDRMNGLTEFMSYSFNDIQSMWNWTCSVIEDVAKRSKQATVATKYRN